MHHENTEGENIVCTIQGKLVAMRKNNLKFQSLNKSLAIVYAVI